MHVKVQWGIFILYCFRLLYHSYHNDTFINFHIPLAQREDHKVWMKNRPARKYDNNHALGEASVDGWQGHHQDLQPLIYNLYLYWSILTLLLILFFVVLSCSLPCGMTFLASQVILNRAPAMRPKKSAEADSFGGRDSKKTVALRMGCVVCSLSHRLCKTGFRTTRRLTEPTLCHCVLMYFAMSQPSQAPCFPDILHMVVAILFHYFGMVLLVALRPEEAETGQSVTAQRWAGPKVIWWGHKERHSTTDIFIFFNRFRSQSTTIIYIYIMM